MTRLIFFFILISFTFTSNAARQSPEQLTYTDPYYDIKEVQIKKVADDYVTAPVLIERNGQEKKGSDLGGLIDTIIAKGDRLIAFGTKVWEIIKKGEPNLNLNLAQPISVMPDLAPDDRIAFTDLDRWSAPQFESYLVEFKNGYGMVVGSFKYTVAFQHSGRYKGKGRYVTSLQVSASDISVTWGFTLDASSQLQTISNRGTKENPVASATMVLNYTFKSFLRKMSATRNFHVTGKGEFINF